MSERRTRSGSSNAFIKQAAILAAAGIAVRLLGFVYRLPLTDLIGDEGNAIYGIGYNVYNFFLIMSSAGIPAAISKMVSEKRAQGREDVAHRIFRISLVLSALTGFIFMLIMFVFAEQITAFMGTREAHLALQTLAPTVFIVAIMAVIRGYFQGMSSTVPTAASQLAEQIFNAIFSIILAHALWNYAMRQGEVYVIYGAAGGTAGSSVGALAGFIVITGLYFVARPDILKEVRISKRRNHRRISSRSDDAVVRKLMEPEKFGSIVKNIVITSFTIIAGTAIFSIANLIDSRMVLTRLADAGFGEIEARELFGQLTGKFNTMTNLPAAISSSLAVALIPTIASAWTTGNRHEVAEKINTALRVAMIFTVPIAFGFGILGPQLVALLFPNHPDGGTLLIVGFPSVIFLAASQIATGVLQAIGKITIPIYAAMAGVGIKVVVSFFLIAHPAVNIYGAIIGTTLMYLVTASINCTLLCRYTSTRLNFLTMFAKPTIASIAMVFTCYIFYGVIYMLVPSNAFATISAILSGVVVYGIYMMLIRGFSDEDIRMLPKGEAILRKLKSKRLM